jgi:hypothetical protein
MPIGERRGSLWLWDEDLVVRTVCFVTTLIAVVAIAIGVLMLGQWALAIARGRVPELATRPAEIRLHLVAEFATAAVLIVGGIATVIAPAGRPLLLFGLGMLTYTTIVSPGYFLDRGERGPVAMFGAIVIFAIAAAVALTLDLAT